MHSKTLNLAALLGTVLAALTVAVAALAYGSLQSLDYDTGLQWSKLSRGVSPGADIWEFYHHQMLPVLYTVLYAPLRGIQPPLDAVRLIFGVFYVSFAVGMFYLSGELIHRFWVRVAVLGFALAGPISLFQLTSFEDNLAGFPFLAFGLYCLTRYFRTQASGQLLVAGGLLGAAFLTGFGYLAWLEAAVGSVLVFHLLSHRASLLRVVLFLGVLAGSVLGPLAIKDAFNGASLFTSLAHTFSNPFQMYSDIVRPFSLADLVSAESWRFTLESLFTTLSGLPVLFAPLPARWIIGAVGLGLAFSLLLLGRALRADVAPERVALTVLLVLASGFQLAYLTISREPSIFERNDYLVFCVPLFLGLTHRYVARRVLAVGLTLLVFVPPLLFSTIYLGRGSNHLEIRALVRESPNVVFDGSFFFRGKFRGSQNYSHIGAVQLSGVRRCYVLSEDAQVASDGIVPADARQPATNPRDVLPTQCEFLSGTPEKMRAHLEAQTRRYVMTRTVRLRLGYESRKPADCGGLAETYVECAAGQVGMNAEQRARFHAEVSKKCAAVPAVLECYSFALDNCEALHFCVVEKLRRAAP